MAISVFQGATLIGSRSLSAEGHGIFEANFNVNFDSSAGAFVVGGLSTGPTGQNWFAFSGGVDCDTVGFSSGVVGQGVCVTSFVDDSFVSGSTLTARRRGGAAVIPLPASLPLLAGGLFGLVPMGRRRRA